MENFLNKIFPTKCLFCGSIGSLFCENCLSLSSLVNPQVCIVCGVSSQEGKTHEKCSTLITPSQLVCVFRYENLIRNCIRKSKYNSKQFMALKILTKESIEILMEWNISFSGYTCVPIPLSIGKQKERGFNQAGVISKIFSLKQKLNYDESLLIRARDTVAQHEYGRKKRFKNIQGCFKSNINRAKGGRFLLIDDICTSGATFLEASKTLYLAGAKEVKCFAISRKI